ncbi:hypothetical protein HK405_003538 [Cladochytrium tenue]|nr:hypothetical protein HK405_003538 [Cladochytrium tenue]
MAALTAANSGFLAATASADEEITGFVYCPPGWDEARLRCGPDAEAIGKIALETFTDISFIKEKNAIQIVGETHDEVYAAQNRLNGIFFPIVVKSRRQWARPDRPGAWGQRRDTPPPVVAGAVSPISPSGPGSLAFVSPRSSPPPSSSRPAIVTPISPATSPLPSSPPPRTSPVPSTAAAAANAVRPIRQPLPPAPAPSIAAPAASGAAPAASVRKMRSESTLGVGGARPHLAVRSAAAAATSAMSPRNSPAAQPARPASPAASSGQSWRQTAQAPRPGSPAITKKSSNLQLRLPARPQSPAGAGSSGQRVAAA